MEDKRLRDKFYNTSDQELQFTKEDRHKVFEQLRELDANPQLKKKSIVSFKKFAPLIVSLLAVGLCMFLYLPSILPGNFNEESNTTVVNDPVVKEAGYYTTLITVKSKEMDDRIYLNLLLTYSKDKKIMKVASLPNASYVPVADNDDGTTVYDKLLFAYNFGGAENVRTTVSRFLDLPIDYYAVIDLETFSTLIDSVNGIDYDLPEDMRVRAVSQVAFDFEKGQHRLNGEEVVALMMAATVKEGVGLDEEDLLNLMNAVMNKTKSQIPPTQLKELFTQIEANVSLDSLIDNQLKFNSIKSVSLSDGMIADHIPLSSTTGKFIYRFEEDFLNSVSKELTTFK
ncbi:LCP family protein [Solibacillus sp. MA9]|uniref:LCP family protein n=1 Tax=Solibacillus palustris TaxID=2908203 RepID=A0ABS9UJ19_9BACL|nr:LCP family protein [Solibacillus sp. MA9]MCH7323920.1 LCP family protein [Solibacillus sp. MA9]